MEAATNVVPISQLTDEQVIRGTFGVYTAKELMAMEIPEPTWLVPSILPQGLTILSGKPKSGKSWMALGLALAISSGGYALGELALQGPRRVLYLALEDTKRRLQNRIKQLDVDVSDDLCIRNEWPAGEEGLAYLDRWLDAFPTDLVIIDTLARLRGEVIFTSDSYRLDYQDVSAIKTLADQYDTAIVCLHHNRKSTAHSKIEMVSGTFGVTGAADTVMVLLRKDQKTNGELYVIGRDVEEREFAIDFSPEDGWTLKGDAEKFRQSESRRNIIELLEEEGDGGMRAKDIAEGLDYNYSTTRVLLSKMLKDGTISREKIGKDTRYQYKP